MAGETRGADTRGDAASEPAADLEARPDSPKRQGDKLGVTGPARQEPASVAPSGDSPKPHGDELERAVTEAAKR